MLEVAHVDWNKTPPIRERVFFGIIFVLCLMMFARVWWEPQQSQIRRFKTELAVVTLQVDALRNLIESTKKKLGSVRAKAEVDQRGVRDNWTRRALSRLSSTPAKELASSMYALTGRRMLGGLIFRSIEAEKPKNVGTHTVIPLVLTVEGSFTGIQRYLKRLERLEKPMIVTHVQITQGTERPGIVEGVLTLNLFTHSGAAVEAGNPVTKKPKTEKGRAR